MVEKRPALILGGTAEARALAGFLAHHPGFLPMTSLAGLTRAPAALPGIVRRGGFGGTEGLAAFLRAQAIAALVDATHPFATRITGQAIAAARAVACPYLRLERPGWPRAAADRWFEVPDLAAAVGLLPRFGRRVLVALGRQGASGLPGHPALIYLIRSIEPPEALPPGATWLPLPAELGEASERQRLAEQRVEAVLCKASGGAAAFGKIAAARSLGLPVVMLRRPPAPEGVPVVADADAACRWLDRLEPRAAIGLSCAGSTPPVL